MIDNKKHFRIALVLYTSGLDYDDRIRKEILSIQELFPNVSFKIFATEPENREEEGVTSYGVPYRIPFLKTREKYPQATHVLAKGLDFYKTIKPELNQFDAIWCADIETILFTLLFHGKPVLWDLHELPTGFMHVWWKRLIFRHIERKIRVMVHANEPRLRYLKEIGMIKHPEKQFVLRNYPQFNEIDNEYDEKYNEFENWQGTSRCVYLQGVTGETRADRESIEAVLSIPGLKAVIIGRTRDELEKELLRSHTIEELRERLFFTGQIKQLKTPQYIKRCCISLIFYKNTSTNNWYCEPNRLFQNLINGNPVVVGNNPPMKEIIEEYGVGICAETDGSEIQKIVDALRTVISNIDIYKKKIYDVKEHLLWKSQNAVIARIVDKFLVE